LAARRRPRSSWPAAIWVSLIFQGFYIEPAAPRPAAAPQRLPDYLGRLAGILRQNRNFRIYLLSRGAAYLGGMGGGFVAVYAVQRYQLPDSTAAVFAGILSAASMVGFGLWGAVGDRWGYKRVLMLSSPMWLTGLGLLLLNSGPWAFYVVFALLGFSNTGAILSDLTMSIEFGPDTERPTYLGLARSATAPALLLAPLIGGWIAQTWGFPAMFGVSFGLAALGLAIMGLVVREPRPRQAPARLGAE
jgi:MFS family permease